MEVMAQSYALDCFIERDTHSFTESPTHSRNGASVMALKRVRQASLNRFGELIVGPAAEVNLYSNVGVDISAWVGAYLNDADGTPRRFLRYDNQWTSTPDPITGTGISRIVWGWEVNKYTNDQIENSQVTTGSGLSSPGTVINSVQTVTVNTDTDFAATVHQDMDDGSSRDFVMTLSKGNRAVDLIAEVWAMESSMPDWSTIGVGSTSAITKDAAGAIITDTLDPGATYHWYSSFGIDDSFHTGANAHGCAGFCGGFLASGYGRTDAIGYGFRDSQWTVPAGWGVYRRAFNASGVKVLEGWRHYSAAGWLTLLADGTLNSFSPRPVTGIPNGIPIDQDDTPIDQNDIPIDQ